MRKQLQLLKNRILVFVIAACFLLPLFSVRVYAADGASLGTLSEVNFGCSKYAYFQYWNNSEVYDNGDGTYRYLGFYESTNPINFYLQNFEPNKVYNGTLTFILHFTPQLDSLPGTYAYPIYFSNISIFDTTLPDGIEMNVSFSNSDVRTLALRFKVVFTNFVPSLSSFDFSTNFNFESIISAASITYNSLSYLRFNTSITDTSGLLYYNDLGSGFGYDGSNYRQNEAMIDQLQTIDSNQVSWFGQIKDTLSNGFLNILNNIDLFRQEVAVDLTNILNAFTKSDQQAAQEHDQTINGYSGSSTPDANEQFKTGLTQYEATETQLTNVSNQNFDSYTNTAFNTNIVGTLATNLTYVVTWFTNFWDLGGLFTSLLNIALAVTVAAFILRFRKSG